MEEEVLSEVVPRDFLRCPLCRDEYQEPKFLPCLHSFCKACIDDHIEATATTTPGGHGRFLCPVCLTEISPPSDAETDEPAKELPDNTFARRLSCPAISRDKQTDRSCHRCEARGGKTEASRHCINCDEFMCGQCSAEHLAEKETASHKTQAIDSAVCSSPPLGVEADDFAVPLIRCCQFYDALDIGTMYCVDCDMATCTECHSKHHADHRCAELSAIAQNFETKIKGPLLELKKDEKKLKKELSYLDTAKNNLVKKQQQLKEMAEERSKMLWTLIQEYQNILGLEIDRRHAKNMAIIEEQHGILKRHMASIYAVTDLTDKLLTFGSMEEKVSMRRQIGRRVRELCEGELPRGRVALNRFVLSEPNVGVDSICEMFGELVSEKTRRGSGEDRKKAKPLKVSNSIDLGSLSRDPSRRTKSISSTDEPLEELSHLEEYEEDEESDVLSSSNASDVLRIEKRRLSSSFGQDDLLNSSNGSGGSRQGGRRMSASYEHDQLLKTSRNSSSSNNNNHNSSFLEVPRFSKHRTSSHNDSANSNSDSSFQSSILLNDVPCHNLEQPVKEIHFPDTVAKDYIKGVGVTPIEGDIVVATASPMEGNKVYILEKRGIVRGQLDLDKNFSIHSIGADGRVYMVVARSENRYKVKVLTADNRTLVDAHIESFGLNGVADMKSGTFLITSSRYASTNPNLGRAAKLGGNVTIYDRFGAVQRVITNESFSSLGMQLFDRPHCICIDEEDNCFVADPGRHSVIGLKADGSFLFEYGTTDAEEELYQGPDAVCTDRFQNVIVLDKKDGRIDILNYQGQLLRCYFPPQHIRFMSVTPDKLLALLDSDGEIKLYDYFME